MNAIGTIRLLARYPVKSMRGEALSGAMLTAKGVPEDRRYAFVQTFSRSGFPWLTARELPELLKYAPSVEPVEAGKTIVRVTTPSGKVWPVDNEALRHEIEERSGRAIYLVHHHRGKYDAATISVISWQTVVQIARETSTIEDPWRFRPNLVVDLHDGRGFEELNWVGRVLRVGEAARIAILEVDYRCAIITLDPETAESNPAILRCVAQEHGKCAGVYGAVLSPGEVRPGDSVRLEH